MALLSRRRFISITALAGITSSILPEISLAKLAADKQYQWRGFAMGTHASMQIYGIEASKAAMLSQQCIEEITRLEKLFSLYESGSVINQLNEQGYINNPPKEFVELLQKAEHFSELTNGAFDITVQPLWQAYTKGNKRDIETSCTLVDYKALSIQEDSIAFTKSNMAITLNGIAQGYITDKVTEHLKANGVENTLVNMGEFRAIGSHPNHQPWQIGIQTNANTLVPVTLKDEAIATSANGTFPNLIHPKTGKPSSYHKSVSVVAANATTADALSTGLFHCNNKQLRSITQSLENIRTFTA